MFESIYSGGELNIFCDASIKRASNNVVYGCPASMVIDSGTIIQVDHTIIPHSTNNESEIYAILLATQQAVLFKDSYKRINIFSDSNISVQGIREWIFNWLKNSDGDILISTSGPVANQQIFLHVVITIIRHLDRLNIYHVRGHMQPDNKRDIKTIMDCFRKNNGGLSITEFDAACLATFNNLVDNYSRNQLDIPDLEQYKRLQPGFIYPKPSDSDMMKYKTILHKTTK